MLVSRCPLWMGARMTPLTDGRVCVNLYIGATIAFGTAGSFGGTKTTNMQWFLVSDIVYSGNGSSAWGILYYSGCVTTWGTIVPNSQAGGGATFNPRCL